MEHPELPEMARKVLAALQQGPMTHGTLVSSTGMYPRTVRGSLKLLKECGLVDSMRGIKTARTYWFTVEKRPTYKIGGVDTRLVRDANPMRHYAPGA